MTIRTTHVGSLPRPHDLLDLMKARLAGQPVDKAAYERRVKSAVEDSVRKQVETGIDIVTDGEQSKPGFFTYVRERLTGIEPRPGKKVSFFDAERQAFPEYYEEYLKRAMTGGSIAPAVPIVCTGPVTYKGAEALRRDIENLKAAMAATGAKAAFMPSIAPSGVGSNEYYKTDEEFFFAVADALRTEYQAIVEAGLYLQIDDPFMTDNFSDPALDDKQRRRFAEIHVEAINHALRGIPAQMVRFHTCYGINEGPRVHDPALGTVAPYMVKVNAGALSFEAANARHEHEYHYWESAKPPGDKVLIPGVITHASNIVEHPELVAERLARFARIVGSDRVIASADCGFSSQATYKPEVHPKVMWAKFAAMVQGARLANARLRR